MANVSPSITPNVNTNRDEMDLSPIRRAKLSPIRRAKLKKKRRILDSSNEDLSESTDCIPDLNASKDYEIVIPSAVISKSPKRRVLQNSQYNTESVNSNPTVDTTSIYSDVSLTSSDEQMDHNEGQENVDPNKLNNSHVSIKKSNQRVLQNSRYTSRGKQKMPENVKQNNQSFDTTFNSSSDEETSNESSPWKSKTVKLTPEKSLSFAVIGSKKVQIADEDPTVPILEKTPDGKTYRVEPRPRRSKQSKRVTPGVELLSKKTLPFDTIPTKVPDEELLQCEDCDYKFESNIDLFTHYKQIHQSPSEETTILESSDTDDSLPFMTQNDSKSKNIAEPEKKSNDSSNSENDIETFTFRRPKVMPTKKGKSSGWSKNKKNANRMKAIREKESKDEHDQRVKKVSESNKKRKSNLTTAELEFEHDREAKRLRMIRQNENNQQTQARKESDKKQHKTKWDSLPQREQQSRNAKSYAQHKIKIHAAIDQNESTRDINKKGSPTKDLTRIQRFKLMNRKAVEITTAEFDETSQADYFKKFIQKTIIPFEMDNFMTRYYICKFCRAKLLNNECTEGTKDERGTFTSNLCCSKGQIQCNGMSWQMSYLQDPPQIIKDLNSKSKDETVKYWDVNYPRNSRKYNNALSLASIGIDEEIIQKHGWNPNVKIHGRIYHRLGPLHPDAGEKKKFGQIIVHDSTVDEEQRYLDELNRRMEVVHGAAKAKLQNDYKEAKAILEVKRETMMRLQKMLHDENPYYQTFKALGEIDLNLVSDKAIVLLANKKPSNEHSGCYGLPKEKNQVAVIDLRPDCTNPADVIVRLRGGGIQKIPETNRSFEPLRFPVLFPNGDDGWHYKLFMTDYNGEQKTSGHPHISPSHFHCHRMMDRDIEGHPEFKSVIRGGKVFQEWACSMHCMAEKRRMDFIRNNQNKIKADKYQGLFDAESGDLADVGVKVILPPTHTGSPRWYSEKFADAMAIVRKFGKPDLFVTMTASADWKEIKDSLRPGESSHDRPDVVTRVFEQKSKELIDDIMEGEIFGKVVAILAVVEWQKRGLPHIHILIFLRQDAKPKSPADVDRFVCAEIPNKEKCPKLHDLVTGKMVHGPCHGYNPMSPCLMNPKKKCEKDFPKSYQEHTTINENGYTTYRRRKDGNTTTKKVKGEDKILHNRWVVPYNPMLLLKYKCHINVEVCTTSNSIKYLFKYVLKGGDKISLVVQDKGEDPQKQQRNEIHDYETGRYYDSTQSTHRIFGFKMHHMYPPVMKLKFHLENEQNVVFDEDDDIQQVLERNEKTHLTQFFQLNKDNPNARNILYADLPSNFTYNEKNKCWQERQQKRTDGPDGDMSPTIGRVPIVALNQYQRELFFARLLIYHRTGVTSFEDLRTITDENGEKVVCDTYQQCCIKLGVTENDDEAREALKDAYEYKQSDRLVKTFFVNLCIHQLAADPWALFQEFKKELSADKLHKLGLTEPTDDIINEVLLELQLLFEKQDKNMAEFIGVVNMPKPAEKQNIPSDLRCERNFDPEVQAEIATENSKSMNEDQRKMVDTIMDAVNKGKGGIFAVEASGGTGKTYTFNTLLARLRSQGDIAVAMAISGMAATFFDGGRTVHHKLKVPIKVSSSSKCNFKENSGTAEMVKEAKLFVIDEFTMGHKDLYETIDRTLKELLGNDLPFGGKVVILGGDWKQILPVVPFANRPDIVQATLKSSALWEYVAIIRLTKNMRAIEDEEFAKYLLEVGNGIVETHPNVGDQMIKIPEEMQSKSTNINELVDEIYPNLGTEIKNAMKDMEDPNWNSFVHERTIICPTNAEVEEVNRICIDKIASPPMVYRSADRTTHKSDTVKFPTEYLNKITPQGCPPHVLVLKKGTPITLMRNMDPENGHVNGAQYNIISLSNKFIHARLAAGPYCDKENAELLIPRIKFLPDDKKTPVEYQRIQFPVRIDFAITSNRAQGRTYKKIGVNLSTYFFSHGQLYVSLSRVGSFKKVSVFQPKNSTTFGYMKNVVFHEVLSNKRIPQTKSDINSDDVVGRNFGDLNSEVILGRLPYHEAKEQLTKPRLDEEGFKLSNVETPSDGNCFLHGILDQMSNDPTLKPFAEQLTHGDLRAQVCETVFDADEHFQLALIPDDNNATDVNLHDWAENMKKDKFWVDHPFIQLTANFLKRNIVIVTIYKEDGTNGSGRIDIEANESTGHPLYLLNWDNIHFQSIFPKEDSTSN